MLLRSILVLCSAALGADAVSLPRNGLNSTEKAATRECDFRLWVRADDLAPSTIVEGDVRLLNNMSGLSTEVAQGCRVLDWSFHLRYRERGAIQIPISNVQLPEKPAYNYSWERDEWGNQDYKVNRMLSNGEDMSSFFESVENPHQSEVQEYHRQLEEYVTAISTADKWIVRDDEVTFFEAMLNITSPLEISEDLQHVTLPFGVAVPSVRFPETSNSPDYFDNGEDVAERILYTDERDLSYFAKLHLANGSIVQVNGGRTKFFTPGINEAIRSEATKVILVQQDGQCGSTVLSAMDGTKKRDNKEQERDNHTISKQNLSAIIEAPSHIVRGHHFTFKGQISSSSGVFIPTRVWIDIRSQKRKKWAHAKIERAGPATSRDKTDLIKNDRSGVYRSLNRVEEHSSALFLKRQLQKLTDEEDRDPFYEMISSHYRRPSPGLAINSKDSSFELEYVPGNDFFGFGTTYFAEHTAEFVVKVEAKRIKEDDLDKTNDRVDSAPEQEQGIHKKFHNEFDEWSEYDGEACAFRNCRQSSQEETQVYIFEGKIPIQGFSNEIVSLKKRDEVLQGLLDRQAANCQLDTVPLHYLDEGALAPFFVDLGSEEKIKEAVSLVNPCSQSSPHIFQRVNTTPLSTQHIPASLSNHSLMEFKIGTTQLQSGSIKYRKTKYRPDRRYVKDDCWRIPGSCGGAGQDVGTVWVKKVMLPKLKSAKAKTDNNLKEVYEQAETPPFLIQT